jgi:hypothetical protein
VAHGGDSDKLCRSDSFPVLTCHIYVQPKQGWIPGLGLENLGTIDTILALQVPRLGVPPSIPQPLVQHQGPYFPGLFIWRLLEFVNIITNVELTYGWPFLYRCQFPKQCSSSAPAVLRGEEGCMSVCEEKKDGGSLWDFPTS